MVKVTSKLQVTVPKSIADRYGIRPGDEIEWESAGEAIRVIPRRSVMENQDVAARLRLFDQATARQRRRQESANLAAADSRGWTRQELYEDGGAG
ncbi:MAG: AbrB/MazE/SpoVT family DNA-binding domain-containing protein [Gammaproteobacteria bacterium]